MPSRTPKKHVVLLRDSKYNSENRIRWLQKCECYVATATSSTCCFLVVCFPDCLCRCNQPPLAKSKEYQVYIQEGLILTGNQVKTAKRIVVFLAPCVTVLTAWLPPNAALHIRHPPHFCPSTLQVSGSTLLRKNVQKVLPEVANEVNARVFGVDPTMDPELRLPSL